jgi:hypothetical protein
MLIKNGCLFSSVYTVCLLLLLENAHLSQAKDLITVERENALLKQLLANYDKKRKPVGKVDIKFALNLNQIFRVKAKDQIIELNSFLDHEWIDHRLSWSNSYSDL